MRFSLPSVWSFTFQWYNFFILSNGGSILKKLIVLFILSAGLLTLTGCDLFGGSDQSSDETTDSSVLKAEKADTTNSVYTLKVRKDMDLSAGQLTFTDKNGMDTHVSDTRNWFFWIIWRKTVLTDIKITTKDDEYIISGKENKKKQQSYLQKSVITVWRMRMATSTVYSAVCWIFFCFSPSFLL